MTVARKRFPAVIDNYGRYYATPCVETHPSQTHGPQCFIREDGRVIGEPYLTIDYKYTWRTWWRIYLYTADGQFYYGYEGMFKGERNGAWNTPINGATGDDNTGPFQDGDAAVEDCLARVIAFCKRKKDKEAEVLLDVIRRSRAEQARQLSLFEEVL